MRESPREGAKKGPEHIDIEEKANEHRLSVFHLISESCPQGGRRSRVSLLAKAVPLVSVLNSCFSVSAVVDPYLIV